MFRFFYHFIILCALFLIYSFIGWMFEVLYAFVDQKKLVNRGFLIGPLVPIWGAGALLITIILKDEDNIFNIVLWSAFIGTFLEYVVNYLMEKIFKARWWDYSHLPFNINGRVWLGASFFFGLGGVLVVKLINPNLFKLFSLINSHLFCIIITVFMISVIVDFCISCNIIQNLKLSADMMSKDSTEEITKKVRNILMEKSKGFRRLLKAFPNISFKK